MILWVTTQKISSGPYGKERFEMEISTRLYRVINDLNAALTIGKRLSLFMDCFVKSDWSLAIVPD